MKEEFGLVLCGGGAKGAYQMGALQALEEEGYLDGFCGVSGVSIGALNGLFLCCCGTETGIKVWKKINPAMVFDMDLSLVDGREGFFSRGKMRELLLQYVNFDKVRTAMYPMYVTIAPIDGEYGAGTVYSNTKRQVEYHKLNAKSDAEIITLMEATTALPVIYEDVSYDGVRYRDGGLLDNMPIKPLYDSGCRKFLVLSLSSDAKVNTSLYPDAEFYLLKPYRDLGGLLSGTLNFTASEISMNLKLGYKDGKRFIKAFLEGDKLIATHYDMYAQIDYDAVMVDIKQETLQAGIDEKLNYMADIMKKYDV